MNKVSHRRKRSPIGEEEKEAESKWCYSCFMKVDTGGVDRKSPTMTCETSG